MSIEPSTDIAVVSGISLAAIGLCTLSIRALVTVITMARDERRLDREEREKDRSVRVLESKALEDQARTGELILDMLRRIRPESFSGNRSRKDRVQ